LLDALTEGDHLERNVAVSIINWRTGSFIVRRSDKKD
jgi:hypothetical protein